ncbi:MAG: hypothetical protein EZS28_003051 [Streblomastix strix]|uniref:Uncharacterized protein n=1 Tax=Streblomastix strix TaxID=222440 RepID=A0A5J4X3S7_9EUKA|nr:MAG: hypothetical protein EZS28_003051 [Streblomastix strix]
MYDQNQSNSGDIVPDQVTPASDATLLVDSGTGVAGTANEYSRGEHMLPLQVSDDKQKRDTGTGAIGTSTTYSSNDYFHLLSIDPTVSNEPLKDTESGDKGNFNNYARYNHAHPLNVDPTIANVDKYGELWAKIDMLLVMAPIRIDQVSSVRQFGKRQHIQYDRFLSEQRIKIQLNQ